MARFRLSRAAELDLDRLLRFSGEYWGQEARTRYAVLLRAALEQIAAAPRGRTTRDRRTLLDGMRSFHLRHTRIDYPEAAVRRPVHVVFYRFDGPGLIEIIRVLHERMEPTDHFAAEC